MHPGEAHPAGKASSIVQANAWADEGIDRVRQPYQATTPEIGEPCFVAAIEQDVSELSHSPTDEAAFEQPELPKGAVGPIPAKRHDRAEIVVGEGWQSFPLETAGEMTDEMGGLLMRNLCCGRQRLASITQRNTRAVADGEN